MFIAAEQNWAKLFSDELLAKAKNFFPHTGQGKIYLNHASSAPMSSRVVEAMTYHLNERSTGVIETYEQDIAKIQECRGRIRSLINADSPERLAFCMNTSDALNVIASGICWKSGDRILLHEDEFPANVWPYLALKRFGVEIDIIQKTNGHPTPQVIADHLTPKTRLVTLSAVQYLTGYRADLESIGELCRSKNILFVVDGIQAVGAVDIDVQKMKIDALAAGAQKWQLGPQGTGWLYLTEELQNQIQPAFVGWLAADDPWDFTNYSQPLAASARRFEGGTRNIPGIWGMDAGLSIIEEFGVETIQNQILALSQMLINSLHKIGGARIITPLAQDERAGIVTMQLPDKANPKQVFKRLLAQEITIALRGGMLRFSPHFYNSATEIALAVSATREALTHA